MDIERHNDDDAISSPKKRRRGLSAVYSSMITNHPLLKNIPTKDWKLILKNYYFSANKPNKLKDENACDCPYMHGLATCLDLSCINRASRVECLPDICLGGTDCYNQQLQRAAGWGGRYRHSAISIKNGKRSNKSIDNHEQPLFGGVIPFDCNDGRGWGLQTTSFFSAGDLIIEYVGVIVDKQDMIRRCELYKRRHQQQQLANKNGNMTTPLPPQYILTLRNNYYIDATTESNLGRFVNHSCSPNCEPQLWTVNGELRVAIVAKVDLDIDDEITMDYNFQWHEPNSQPCFCRSANCRKILGGRNSSGIHNSYKINNGNCRNEKNDIVNNTDTNDAVNNCNETEISTLCDEGATDSLTPVSQIPSSHSNICFIRSDTMDVTTKSLDDHPINVNPSGTLENEPVIGNSHLTIESNHNNSDILLSCDSLLPKVMPPPGLLRPSPRHISNTKPIIN